MEDRELIRRGKGEGLGRGVIGEEGELGREVEARLGSHYSDRAEKKEPSG